jgi:hypothetical protein
MPFITLALATAFTATVAQAQTAPATPAATPQSGAPAAAGQPVQPAVGATVVDTAGAPVGTIETIAEGTAIINTGTNKAPYPLTSMTPGPKGPIIALTKAQLDGFYAEQAAKTAAALVTGAAVKTRNGAAEAGKIKSVAADSIVLTTAAGQDVSLPRNIFAVDPQGGVVIGFTAEQFAQAISAAQPTPAQ